MGRGTQVEKGGEQGRNQVRLLVIPHKLVHSTKWYTTQNSINGLQGHMQPSLSLTHCLLFIDYVIKLNRIV